MTADVPTPAPSGRDQMPRWVPRAVGLVLAAVLGLLTVLWLLDRLRDLLVLLLISFFIAFALEPAVNALERRGWSRGTGTLAVFAAVFVATTAFLVLMGALLVDQATTLIDEAPGYIESAESWLESTFDVEIDTDELVAEFREGGAAGDLATRLAGDIFDVGRQLVTFLFQGLTVALFTFYLVADGPKFRRAVCSFLSADRQREVLRAWDLAVDKTGGFLYSRALLGLISGLAHWLAFILLELPSPAALGLFVGLVSQFVPVVGTYIAGVVPALIALVENPVAALWVIGFVVVYQQFENYLLLPRITAEHLDMHPAVAFGAVIAGASILGPVGAFLALPAGATGQAFVSSYLARHDLVDDLRVDAPAPRVRVSWLERVRRARRIVGQEPT